MKSPEQKIADRFNGGVLSLVLAIVSSMLLTVAVVSPWAYVIVSFS